MNILLVDDEKLLVKGLMASLKIEGFNVWAAYSGNDAYELICLNKFDVIILDIMLPGMDGMSLLRKIRETSNVPVIMLTAKDDHVDMALGLEMGADDYVVKPFNTRVLIARIKTVTRRAQNSGTQENFKYKDISVDFKSMEVIKAGNVIALTSKEFDILSILVKNRGVVLSRERLFEMVWNDSDFDTRTVDVHISNLREKLEDDSSSPQYIKTKWGVGYYFVRDIG